MSSEKKSIYRVIFHNQGNIIELYAHEVSQNGLYAFVEVGDIIFETRSGELIHMVLVNPTPYTEKMDLEKDKSGHILIPFSAVIAIGDFMVVAEEDIV